MTSELSFTPHNSQINISVKNFNIEIFQNSFWPDHLVISHDPPLPPGDVKGEVFKDSIVVIPPKKNIQGVFLTGTRG